MNIKVTMLIISTLLPTTILSSQSTNKRYQISGSTKGIIVTPTISDSALNVIRAFWEDFEVDAYGTSLFKRMINQELTGQEAAELIQKHALSLLQNLADEQIGEVYAVLSDLKSTAFEYAKGALNELIKEKLDSETILYNFRFLEGQVAGSLAPFYQEAKTPKLLKNKNAQKFVKVFDKIKTYFQQFKKKISR